MPSVRQLLEEHLDFLVRRVGARPPGSPANQRATAYVRDVLASCGLAVVEHPFTTRWWEPGDGRLEFAAGTVAVAPNPYSPAGDVRGPTRDVASVDQLDRLDEAADHILVLRGELVDEQVFPAAFPFLDVPDHARIRAALARLAPRAIVAVSDHWQPILEDPDLRVPSTTVPTAVGAQLDEGEEVRLVLGGAVHTGRGTNVSAHTGDQGRRLVLSAHLDSKATTPGAFDNAAGVATLLAVAATAGDDIGPCEVVLFNGEDHFDACGEVAWLGGSDLGGVTANVNVDGIGLAGQGTSLTALACPADIEDRLSAWVDRRAGWSWTDPWFESDHAIFAMRDIPAVAVTSQDVHQLLGGLAHTPADTLDVLDLDVLEDVVVAIPELLGLLRDGRCSYPARATRRPAR